MTKFIRLSFGIVNVDNINIITKSPGDDWDRIHFRGDAEFSCGPGVTKEDIEKLLQYRPDIAEQVRQEDLPQ